jgi:hypothetical protein
VGARFPPGIPIGAYTATATDHVRRDIANSCIWIAPKFWWIRAGIHNAVTPESVDALVPFMKQFEKKNG